VLLYRNKKYREVVAATADQDVRYQKTADRMYDELLTWAKDFPLKNSVIGVYDGLAALAVRGSDLAQTADTSAVWQNGLLIFARIKIGKQHNVKAVFDKPSTSKTWKLVSFCLARHPSTYQENPNVLAQAIEKRKDNFIHELIHLQDSLRFVQRDEYRSAPGSPAYYRDPGEYNAYYQAGANALRLAAEEWRHSYNQKDDFTEYMALFLDKDFNTFWNGETWRKYFNTKFVTAVMSNTTYRKKFQTRLSQLWQVLSAG
jgi:hypothetical protein